LSNPVVALVGRQNVGKSTLLNRIAGKPLAIVEDLPGTTRDRLFAEANWNGIPFTIVDTGGLEFQEDSHVAREVRQQAETAIREADVIIFMTDAKEGLMPVDYEVADMLRRSEKQIVLAVNKVDSDKQINDSAEFYQLGFGDPFPLSGYHGRWVAELLDKVVSLFPPQDLDQPKPEEGLKIAIVGRPGVGKSSLVNALLGTERSIVGETPGTTRDATDTAFDFNNQNVILIDTAGIRRRGKVEKGIEWYSVLRAMRAIDRADIGLLVVDATEPLTDQDAHIAGYIEKAGKGIIVVVNKWDLSTEQNKTAYDEYIYSKLKFASYAPILYISAKLVQGINKIMPMAIQVQQERAMRIPDTEINELVKEAVASHNRPRIGKKILDLYSVSQSGINPPTFRFLVNDSKLIHFSYERFLENKLREIYGFKGTPIRLVFKTRG
jgi:GTPase